VTVSPELDRRFREAAAREGLVDLAYDLTDSPVGKLLLATTERGICRISFEPEPDLDDLARTFGSRVLRVPGRLHSLQRELDEYFEGRRHEFDLPIDLRATPFQTTVLHELARVPYGQVETYGALATRIGKPRAARAVGGALNRNPIAIVLPCHRVVGTNGSLVGYAGGLERKAQLLQLEGALMS
jgi:methylated-DNA-[protein]-cysteine S-methyltransferase